MKTSLIGLGLTVSLLLSTGCVSQRQYDDVQNAYRRAQEQNVELTNRIAELQQQIEALKAGPRDNAQRVIELTAERNDLLDQLKALKAQYETLANQPPPQLAAVVLPQQVDEALKAFAAQNSDLVEYDPARGMVKFRSDLTFALGSADVTGNAKSSLTRLAGILNGDVASGYEVRVVGHTDNVRISRPATLAKHPTNWHLSAHRAIAVRDVLQGAGVSAERTSVSGYGMYRPVEANTGSGSERNRRVEIYLVPMAPVNRDFINASSAPAPAPAPEPKPRSTDIPLK
ncbi:MAG: OmpA/MotB family protein [Planctomycetota bacterium]|jgi:chemotaxis protein MotB